MKKYQIIGLAFIAIIAFYGITSVYGETTMADSTDGMHYQHGAMDGTHSQDHAQLRDGSGTGGMYMHGTYNNSSYNNGTCGL